MRWRTHVRRNPYLISPKVELQRVRCAAVGSARAARLVVLPRALSLGLTCCLRLCVFSGMLDPRLILTFELRDAIFRTISFESASLPQPRPPYVALFFFLFFFCFFFFSFFPAYFGTRLLVPACTHKVRVPYRRFFAGTRDARV